MHRGRPVVADLESARLADPGQAALHDPADLAQPAAVRRPLPRQPALDVSLPQALPVLPGAVGPVPVQSLRLAARPAFGTSYGRDGVHQRHSLRAVVAVGPTQTHGQRGAVAVDDQVAFRALFGPIRGVLAGQDPPKTARMLWLSTQTACQSMRPSLPRRLSMACRSF